MEKQLPFSLLFFIFYSVTPPWTTKENSLAVKVSDEPDVPHRGRFSEVVCAKWLADYNKGLEVVRRRSAAALWASLVRPGQHATTQLQNAQAALVGFPLSHGKYVMAKLLFRMQRK